MVVTRKEGDEKAGFQFPHFLLLLFPYYSLPLYDLLSKYVLHTVQPPHLPRCTKLLHTGSLDVDFDRCTICKAFAKITDFCKHVDTDTVKHSTAIYCLHVQYLS